MTALSTKVSVIIPNWNGCHWLKGCLDSLKVQDFQSFEIIVVDDASTDKSADFIEQNYPEVSVLKRTEHGGFVKSVNMGIEIATGDYLILLNSDTVPSPAFVRNLVQAMDMMPPEVGSVTSCMIKMENPDIIDDAGDQLTWYGLGLKRGHGRPVNEFTGDADVLSACAGAALYRRNFLGITGGFDEKFVSYLEDLDLGLRGNLFGYRCRFVSNATVLHKGHGSGIPQCEYVRFMTRNRLLLIGKNIPFSLLVRHFPHLLIGQISLIVQYRRPFDSVAGYLSFLSLVPHVFRERNRILAKRTLTDQATERLLILTDRGVFLPKWRSREKKGDVDESIVS